MEDNRMTPPSFDPKKPDDVRAAAALLEQFSFGRFGSSPLEMYVTKHGDEDQSVAGGKIHFERGSLEQLEASRILAALMCMMHVGYEQARIDAGLEAQTRD